MKNLYSPMPEQEIEQLDLFEKIQLFNNVYKLYPFNKIPSALKKIYLQDAGLINLQSVLFGSNLQDPYEISKIIKLLNPAKPKTLQEIYNRAKYLADICDTSIKKILLSDFFHVQDFIPKLTDEALSIIFQNGSLGLPIPLKITDYTPTSDDSEQSSDSTNKNEIYFTISNDNIQCNTPFEKVIENLPKLPKAKIIKNSDENYQNMFNTSCNYDLNTLTAYFYFIKIENSLIKIFIINYSQQELTFKEYNLIIDGNF